MNQSTYVELTLYPTFFIKFLDFIEALEKYNESELATARSIDMADRLRDYYFNFGASKAIYLKPDPSGSGEFVSLRLWGNDVANFIKVMLEVMASGIPSSHTRSDFDAFCSNVRQKYPDRVWQTRSVQQSSKE